MNEKGRGKGEEGRKNISEEKAERKKRRSVVWVGKREETKTAQGNAREGAESRKGGRPE
jgi:hypothetical protein